MKTIFPPPPTKFRLPKIGISSAPVKDCPLISVVVPVYNAEKYLRDCVESVLSQTFTDFELILVDDGSTDRSGEICDEFAKKDPRSRAFHKENEGTNLARRLGVEHSRGEWICFVDSDDLLPKDALKDLLSEATDNTDWVQGMHQEFEEEGTPRAEIRSGKIRILDLVGLVENMLFYHPYPWGKLVRKNLFSSNVFKTPREITSGEDTHMNFRIIANKPRNAKEIDRIVYFYRQRENSISHLFLHTENYISCTRGLFLLEIEKFPDVSKRQIECAISRKIHGDIRSLLESCTPIKSPQKLAPMIRPIAWKTFRYFFNYVCLTFGYPQIARVRMKISAFLRGKKRH